MEDDGDLGNPQGSSDGAKHTAQPYNGSHPVGHQLDTGVIGSGQGNAHADSGEQ